LTEIPVNVKVPPEQMAGMGLKLGVTAAFIVVVFVPEAAAQPPPAAMPLVTV
jgi:hypothetical protein